MASFERHAGVKGLPQSGGHAALDASVAFKTLAIRAIDAARHCSTP
jgi:hypothetical protein